MSQHCQSLLITGVDTGVGKTMITRALWSYAHRYRPQERWGILKPMQSGTAVEIGDGDYYCQTLALQQTASEVCPLSFAAPLAPPIAAELEQRTIDLAPVWQTYQQLQKRFDYLLVEGIGGLGSPITWEWTVADLAAAWKLPIVLVATVRLGAIAQIVANIALARQYKLDIRGLILNCVTPCSDTAIAQWTPPEFLSRFTRVPVLGVLPCGQHSNEQLAEMVAEWPLDLLWR
ncbi:MAG TPA: ATP-dependent dethiobiotin synthetase BioD [Thermosynechococcus sp. M98_K2018_005]|uniref:dethiobiotin synthase n=1 Tax=Thermosynechococcus sp. M98_K2018_005 TaxID=2747811 RepID=UPI0019FC5D5C|nr:ATP-dependent dethiobiotin synthetase BioD [Thermosynechococcus sp. M98_K2018_005]HIK48146.1 ATP-dependent dethiobiotin synthetase BioD [Thermosynechococcus sp. M55_K2018_012]